MDTKLCPRCNFTKPRSDFGFKSKAKGTLHSHCKTCCAEKSALHYQSNKDTYVSRADLANNKQRAHLRAIRANYLATRECEDCESKTDLQAHYRGKGKAAHEVIAGALHERHLVDALKESVFVCLPCVGRRNVLSSYGTPPAARHEART